MNSRLAIGELRERRVQAGLSQERLARAADCSTSMVRLVEHGYRPSDEMLRHIAAALGLGPGDLLPINGEAPGTNRGYAKTSDDGAPHAAR